MHHAATAITAPDTDQLPAYWQFHDAVAQAQLLAWLPRRPRLIIDVSGPRGPGAELAAAAGHTVVRVVDAGPAASRETPPGEITHLVADSSRLSFLRDGCADDVIAEDRALSTHLAAEAMIAEIARVLRPAGRVLACVDSLVLGMAVLADQHHWAHLVDLPHAEVVLVPWPDGTITRCYGPDQARELFSGAGLTVNWIRPRTVFSESMVTHVLRRDPGSLAKLVRAELAARSDESLGAQLVISAVKLGGGRALAAAGVLGLAADAAGRVGPRIEPPLGNIAPAADASPVGVLVDAGERGEHAVALAAGRVQDRFGAIGLGQGGSRIGRVLRIPRPGQGRGALALQDGYRPVQVVTHLLKALTGDGYLHWCPRLPSACAAQPRLG